MHTFTYSIHRASHILFSNFLLCVFNSIYHPRSIFLNLEVPEKIYSKKGEHMCPVDGYVCFRNSEHICGRVGKVRVVFLLEQPTFHSHTRTQTRIHMRRTSITIPACVPACVTYRSTHTHLCKDMHMHTLKYTHRVC